MFIIAHANHPELFFTGVIVGAVLALAHVTVQYFRNRR